MKPGAAFQALSELIALDFLATGVVMALLTNLTDYWQFFWVSQRSNNQAIINTAILKTPSEAFAVIRALLQPPAPSAADAEPQDMTLPCLGGVVKRRKLTHELPLLGEDGGGDIRASIRQYYDIASMLGPDIEMARAMANRVVRSIPVFSMYT